MPGQQNHADVESVQGLASLYGGVLQNLSMIQAADNAVESKAGGVVAFSLAVIALVVERTQTWHVLTIVSLVLITAALGLGLWCMRIRNYQSATVSLADHPEYLTKASEELIAQLVADAEAAVDNGSGKLGRKADIFKWSLFLFVIGTLIAVLSFKLRIVVI